MKLKNLIFLLALVFILGACSNNISENNKLSEKNITKQVKVEKNEIINSNTGIVDYKNEKKLVNVSLDDFKKELSKNDSIIIDLRTLEELKETGIIPGAKQIDFYSNDFKDQLNSLDKNKKYLIYCRSGVRSSETLKLMKTLGFMNVVELRGGMNGWLNAGEKTVQFSEKYNKNMIQNSNMKKDMGEVKEKIITINARKWEFNKKIIRVKKGDKLTIKINNIDGLHGIAIPDMKIIGNDEIKVDTSKAGEYQFRCLNYCGAGHDNMLGKLIIE